MALDIDDATKKVSKIDKLLTSIEQLWKKHWKLLTIILLVSSLYLFVKWAMSLQPVENNDVETEQQDTTKIN